MTDSERDLLNRHKSDNTSKLFVLWFAVLCVAGKLLDCNGDFVEVAYCITVSTALAYYVWLLYVRLTFVKVYGFRISNKS